MSTMPHMLTTKRKRAVAELRELFILSGRYPHLDEHDLWQSCLCFVDTVLEATAPSSPIEILDEIARLALRVTKEQVHSYAEAGGMRPRHKRFTCKCGADWMTVLPDVDTCQRCYHMGQPDIADWIKGGSSAG